MSTAVATAAPTGTHHSPLRHAVRVLLRAARPLTVWFWVVVVVATLVATPVVAAVNGTVEISLVGLARQGGIWVLFSLAIVLVAVHLRAHLAAGMTRRTFARASLLATVGTAAAWGVLLTVLVLAEGAVHRALGWDTHLADAILPDPTSSPAVLLAELVPLHVVAAVTGLLVGVVYQRGGGWWGTLTLPLTCLPMIALVSTDAEQVGFVALTDSLTAGVAAGVHVASALVLAAVAAAVYAALVRAVVVRTTT